MNKKQIKEYNKNLRKAIFFFSLAAIVLVSGICQFINDFILKPTFTITQEVCHNDTGEYSGYNCSDGYIAIPLFAENVENYTLIDNIFCSKIHETWKEEVCSQEEVEEISLTLSSEKEIKEAYNYSIYCIENSNSEEEVKRCKDKKYNKGMYTTYINNTSGDLKTTLTYFITKSFIKENHYWLDENCECTHGEEPYSESSCSTGYYKNFSVITSCQNKSGYERCSKYSCFDKYKVEVKNE